MTPLNVIADEACDRALMARAGLSYSDIARAAGMSRQQLNNVRGGACSQATLERVLKAIHELTGLRFDLGLVEVPAEKS